MLIGTLTPVSNRADWIDCISILDTEDDDALIDLTGCSIVMAICADDGSQLASATTDDETITIVDTGVFQFNFDRATMATLEAGTYQVGCTIGLEDETAQLLIGMLPVMDGWVPV